MGALLEAVEPGEEHPWPADLPSGRMGVFGGPRRLPVTLVQPLLVVEIQADGAFEYLKWRHQTRFVRVRPDLDPLEVGVPHR